MPKRRLLHRARTIVTLRGEPGPRAGEAMSELSIVEHGSVAIDGQGRIAWVGPQAQVPAEYRDEAEVLDCRGKTLVPGLVDPHTHVVWAGHRRDELELRLAGADYEEIFARGGGILSSVEQTRQAREDDLYAQTLARVRRMRAAGTTTLEIKSGYGLDLPTELRQLRVARRLRAAGFRVKTTCLAAHAIPKEAREAAGGREAFVDRVCTQILPAVAAQHLADYADVFCDRGAFTVEESRRVLGAARDLGLGLRVHANELGSTGGAMLAAELRAASADHLLHLSDDERRALREGGVVATLLPGTSLVLGKGYADGRALVRQGVAVAVATDCNPGSCALESLALVLGLACYGCRLSPAEALCAATHNAAASLGLDHEVGSLVPGRSADLLVLDTDDYRDLVYHAGSPLIDAVWQAGEPVA
ncbi:MAG: imidazolonepropionase [Myxococcales bacterium]|nr:imidazolonepropionase [Myxococcales bacterium]